MEKAVARPEAAAFFIRKHLGGNEFMTGESYLSTALIPLL